MNGKLMEGVEMKLIDLPELGYTNQDKPFPRGEIAVRSNVVSPGYFRQPGETAESFHDGWFLTGDLGELASQGVDEGGDVMEGFVTVPDVAGLDVGHQRASTGVALVIKASSSDDLIRIDRSEDRTRSARRIRKARFKNKVGTTGRIGIVINCR